MVKDVCREKCKDYKPTWKFGRIMYGKGTGIVRCRTCYEFLQWEGNWCPCCGCRVSHRPRNSTIKLPHIRM